MFYLQEILITKGRKSINFFQERRMAVGKRILIIGTPPANSPFPPSPQSAIKILKTFHREKRLLVSLSIKVSPNLRPRFFPQRPEPEAAISPPLTRGPKQEVEPSSD